MQEGSEGSMCQEHEKLQSLGGSSPPTPSKSARRQQDKIRIAYHSTADNSYGCDYQRYSNPISLIIKNDYFTPSY